MLTVLVTGGAGFIGSHNIKRLIEKGYDVVIVDNFNDYYDPQLKRKRIKSILSGMDFKLYEDDITDIEKLKKIFQKNRIDIVVHQAAQAGVRYSIENPLVYEKVNIRGTLNILECCKEFKVKKLVFASSSSVYGNRTDTPFKENDCTDFPSSLYGATKKAAENICYSYHSLYKIPITCLRYFTVIGPWSRPDMAPIRFAKRIIEGKPIDVYGEGKMKRDFTYIDDIVEGVMLATEKDFDFQIFNLGYGNPTKLTRFIELLEGALGKKAKKNYLPMQKGDVSETYADISKAKEMLGWEPKVSLEEGVKNFAEWYKDYYKE